MYMYLKNLKKKKYRFVHVTFMYYMYTHVYIPACELSLYQKVQRSLYYLYSITFNVPCQNRSRSHSHSIYTKVVIDIIVLTRYMHTIHYSLG